MSFKNVIVAQSGGPTAVINSSLLGVYEQAKKLGACKVYGARYGICGVFDGKFIDLDNVLHSLDNELLAMQTPASLLGSCRRRLPAVFFYEARSKADNFVKGSDYEKIASIFKQFDVSAFFYIGGNDSMETVWKLASVFKGTELNSVRFIGVPKTIDNDLEGTDHCPGFGSAAKFVATSFLELDRDLSVYDKPSVTIIEVMGRDAGWLTAASALARLNGAKGPDLIYCCENDFNLDLFLADVERGLSQNKNGRVLIAVSEGLDLKNQCEKFSGEGCDDFGHVQNAGVAKALELVVAKQLGCKVRSFELSLLQRASAHIASKTDVLEARAVGRHAVDLAFSGKTGVMATIQRNSNNPYSVEFSSVDVANVAGRVKKMPANFIAGNFDVSKEAVDWLTPLIQGQISIKFKNGLPAHLILAD